MHRAIILGGTSGLGYELAKEAARRELHPAILGRTAESLHGDPALPGAGFYPIDLSDPQHDYPQPILNGSADYFFWVAGMFHRQSFVDTTHADHHRLWRTHVLAPLNLLRMFLKGRGIKLEGFDRPLNLVIISSTSAWRLRHHETEYCMVKATKAAFARQIVPELVDGSKVLLALPGGMRTEKFWAGTGADTKAFMDPAQVSQAIWSELDQQVAPYHEVNILRQPDGSMSTEYGPKTPEVVLSG